MKLLGMRLHTAVILAFMLTLSSRANAQSHTLDTIKNRFLHYRDTDFQEKIFVHFDRTAYLTGENMWFKIYCVNGQTNQPQDVSKVAYVEVLDKGNQRVLEAKIKLEQGFGDGTFYIPATLPSGNYSVRAYTAWMKNKSAEYFFQQQISIVNAFKTTDLSHVSKPKVDGQFLPEGGNLVADVSNKVAFRVTDEASKGFEFRGTIVNAKNDSILHFRPLRFGMGSFTFIPARGELYRAVIDDGKKKYIFPLPETRGEGFSLGVVTRGDQNLDVVVKSTIKNSPSPFVHLIVHSKNKIVTAETKFLTNQETKFSVDKEKLSDGISHITLFDDALNPVCERLVYKKPKNVLALKSITNTDDYSIRSKGKVSVSVTGIARANDLNLSVSIYRKDSLSIFTQQNIAANLLLTSDLAGSVEAPEFYLTEGTDEHFDNLMLTHGWRKFSWLEILKQNQSPPAYLPELQGPLVTGVLYDLNDKPAPNIGTHFSAPSKIVTLHGSVSDQNGGIQYVVPEIIGKQKIYLQTNFSKDSVYKFKLENPFSNTTSTVPVPPLVLTEGLRSTILARSVALQVQDIFHPQETTSNSGIDSTAFFGPADETYFLDDYTRFPVMEEVMREYVKGVWVRKRNNGFYFKVLDNINKNVFNDEPLVLLDGVPVFNTTKLMAFDPKKIKKISVMTRAFFLGRQAFHGIVSFSTYGGDLAGFEVDKKSVMVDFEGLQAKRIFYAPAYDTERQRSNRLPDQRTLLLWKPYVTTSNGNAEIEFYTSDVPGEYEINIQGLNAAGQMGSARSTFNVRGYDNE